MLNPDEVSEYVVGLISAPTMEEAQKLSAMMIRKKLAACCTILPQTLSIYAWEGKIEKKKECLIIVKTRQNVFEQLIDEVRKKHSYDLPEIICLPMTGGLKGYLGWIDENTQLPPSKISI